MVPVQIEAAELSQALATGVADSFISSGSTGYDRKVWEQLNYFYDVQAWLPRNVVFANKDAWNGLDEATQKVVTDCADQAAKDGEAKAKELTDFYLKDCAKHGMKVCAAEPDAREAAQGLRRDHDQGMAQEGRRQGQGDHRRLQGDVIGNDLVPGPALHAGPSPSFAPGNRHPWLRVRPQSP